MYASGVRYPNAECGRCVVVVLAPSGDLGASIVDVEEERLVEQFIAHSAIEAFRKAILVGFPGAMKCRLIL